MNTPIELSIARENGYKTYFTGKPCPNGHIAERYTNSSKCILCIKNRSKRYGPDWFQKNKEKKREQGKKWRQNNKEKCVEYQIIYRKRNPDKYQETLEKRKAKQKIYSKEYNKKNAKSIYLKKKQKLDNNIVFRISELVRARIQSGLRFHVKKNNKKNGKSIMYLGCSFEEYKRYLENKFKNNMCWENMGGQDGWQIDHIIPLAHFDLSKESERLKAFNYKNTQPLEKFLNQSKGARLNMKGDCYVQNI